MTQRSHVPQFGNWGNGENVLYTAYFENARKGKTGGMMINPNDPQQNPGLFPVDSQPQQMKANSSRSRVEPEVQVGKGMVRPKNDNRSSRSTNEDARRQNDFPSRPDPAVRRSTAADSYHQQRTDRAASSRDNPRRPVQQNIGAERGRIDQSSHHPHNQANVGSRAGGVSSPSPESKPSGSNYGSTPNRQINAQRAATVLPKFGAWDEKNPSSADGYTQIFNVVREEKKLTGVASVTATPVESTPNRRKPGNDKMTCCFL